MNDLENNIRADTNVTISSNTGVSPVPLDNTSFQNRIAEKYILHLNIRTILAQIVQVIKGFPLRIVRITILIKKNTLQVMILQM